MYYKIISKFHFNFFRLKDDLDVRNPFVERKYVVFEAELTDLFSLCRSCRKPCQIIKRGESVTAVEFYCHCCCGHVYTWRSQPYSFRLPLGNLVLGIGR